MTKTAPRLYVACLSSYNSGVLHGRWVDADQCADSIRSEIAAMLRESQFPNVEVDCPECDGAGCEECRQFGKVPSAEEWAVHDFEGFGEIDLGEHPDLDEVAALAEAIEEHGEPFLAWAANASDNRDPDDFQDHFSGEWDDLETYVEDFWEQSGWKPEDGHCWWHPTRYVNWEAMARDLELSGDVWTARSSDFKKYVFSNS
jgi:antirestriction protein